MANKGPRMPDINTIKQVYNSVQSGQQLIEQSALAPIRAQMKRMLEVNDRQLAINRHHWGNLPPEVPGDLIERILYYRGDGMLFYFGKLGKWFFLPYTLTKGLDTYGRYMEVRPLPFMGTDQAEGADGKIQDALLSMQTRVPVYDLSEDITTEEFLETRCILLHDYSLELSQKTTPRHELNQGILGIEANIIPYVNTMLSNSTGVGGLRVQDGDQQESVEVASQTAQLAALNGKRWLAITSPLEFQDLSIPTATRAEDMLLAMQSIDNIRVSSFGLDTGGIFEKKAHLLQAEAQLNMGTSGLVMEDGLTQRRTFCDILNWYVYLPAGLPLEALAYCESSEVAAGADKNLDGMIGDEGANDSPTAPQGTPMEGEVTE